MVIPGAPRSLLTEPHAVFEGSYLAPEQFVLLLELVDGLFKGVHPTPQEDSLGLGGIRDRRVLHVARRELDGGMSHALTLRHTGDP